MGRFLGPPTAGPDLHRFLEQKNHQRLAWAFLSIGYGRVIAPQRRSDVFLQGCFKSALLPLLAPLWFHRQWNAAIQSLLGKKNSDYRQKNAALYTKRVIPDPSDAAEKAHGSKLFLVFCRDRIECYRGHINKVLLNKCGLCTGHFVDRYI